MVVVRLLRDSKRVEDYALADSGAEYSIFDAGLAQELEVEIHLGRHVFVQGLDGQLISIYLHRLGIVVGSHRLSAEIGFSNQLRIGFNILGRHSIFDQLQFCFNDRDHELTLTRL